MGTYFLMKKGSTSEIYIGKWSSFELFISSVSLTKFSVIGRGLISATDFSTIIEHQHSTLVSLTLEDPSISDDDVQRLEKSQVFGFVEHNKSRKVQ